MSARIFALDNREAWLRARRAGLGASDAAAVLGLSPWKTPLQLFAEKLGLVESSVEESEAMHWGTLLEPVIADRYRAETGRALVDPGRYTLHISEARPWQFATLDREILGAQPGVLEIKTTAATYAENWRDEPPLVYQLQLQHQLAVTGWTWGSLAVLIGGQRFVWCDLERNDAVIELLVRCEAAFWRRVETNDPPDPDAEDKDLLAVLWPRDDGSLVTLPTEADDWDRRLVTAKTRLIEWTREKDEVESLLKASIGDARVGVCPSGVRYTWRAHERAGYTVAPTTVRQLRRVRS